jgi:hypothetical protein
LGLSNFRHIAGSLEMAARMDIQRLMPRKASQTGRRPPGHAMQVHKVCEVIADVLLDCVADAQVRGDVRVDLVSRPADLSFEIAAEWSQILVQNLEAAAFTRMAPKPEARSPKPEARSPRTLG